MSLLPRRRLTRVLVPFALALLTATGTPAVAAETEGASSVNLSLRPVDQEGAYFQLTLEPGESQQLQVEMGNHGTEAIDVRTYPADAYTVVNGGFGAEERDTESTDTTTWLDYPAEVMPLPADQVSVRSFSVSVPEDTEPGQYITSLVLENDTPIEGSGAVALDQIVRQALPVTVRVPGPLDPAFDFKAASHTFAADRSVVAVGTTNTGNAHLAPAGELTIRDDDGEVVEDASATMGTFFAGTETTVEITLDSALEPGDYTVSVSMTDQETGASATAENLAFTVEGEPAEEVPADTEQRHDSGNNVLLYVLTAAVLALLAAVVILLRRNQAQNSTAPEHEATDKPTNT